MAVGRRRGTLRGTVEVTGSDSTTRKLRALERELDSVGRRGMEIGRRMRAAGPGIAVGVVAIGAAVAAAERLGRALVQVGRQVHELGRRGGEISAIATAFETLASPDLLARLEESSGWLVSERRLMAESVQVLRSRILTEEQWTESIGAITRLAQDAGESTDDMVRAFADIASGGGAESLQRLGVNVAALRDQLRQAGLSTESFEGRVQIMRGALDQFREILGGTARNEASNYADATDRMANRLEAYRDSVARSFAENEHLLGVLREVEEAFVSLSPEADDLGDLLAEAAVSTVELAADAAGAVQPILDLTGALMRLYGIMALIGSAGFRHDVFSDMVAQAEALGRVGRQIDITARNLRARLADVRAGRGGGPPGTEPAWEGQSFLPGEAPQTEESQWQEILSMGTRGPQSIQTSVRRRRGGGGGGGGGRPYLRGLEAAYETERSGLRDITASLIEIADLEETRAESLEFAATLDERMARLEEERARAGEERLADLVKAEQARQDEILRSATAREREFEILQQTAEKEEELRQLAQQRIEQNIQGLSSVAGSIGQIFGQIAEAEERAGKAADGWRKAQGVALGIYHTVMAVGEAAKSIGSYGDPVGMVMHAISAVQHGVAAGLAFSQLAQTGGGGVAAKPTSTAGTFRPARSKPERGRPVSEGGRTINLYSWGRSSAEAGRVIAEADWELQRKGLPVQTPRGIGFAA